jgi:hypothetical protein
LVVYFEWAQGRNSIFQKKNFYFKSLHHHKIVPFMYLCFYNISTIYLKLNVNEVLMSH